MAAGVDTEMATDVADDDGLTRTGGLGDVDAGRVTTGAGATSDVRRDEVLNPIVQDQVVLPETL